MSDGADRREARRFTMSLPMRVLPPEAKGREFNAQTRDVSYRGLYFLADANFKIGSEIDFVITLNSFLPRQQRRKTSALIGILWQLTQLALN